MCFHWQQKAGEEFFEKAIQLSSKELIKIKENITNDLNNYVKENYKLFPDATYLIGFFAAQAWFCRIKISIIEKILKERT